ncbi:hypothetical protein V8E54_009656 [Elaphomyces granulatus]
MSSLNKKIDAITENMEKISNLEDEHIYETAFDTTDCRNWSTVPPVTVVLLFKHVTINHRVRSRNQGNVKTVQPRSFVSQGFRKGVFLYALKVNIIYVSVLAHVFIVDPFLPVVFHSVFALSEAIFYPVEAENLEELFERAYKIDEKIWRHRRKDNFRQTHSIRKNLVGKDRRRHSHDLLRKANRRRRLLEEMPAMEQEFEKAD